MEDFLIDIFYWFDKSSKRKGKLAEYFEFCNQEYQKILKHISICWLSLERCIHQVLKKLLSIKLYFESEHFADAHFQTLHAAFSNPIFQSVLLFHSASIQLFTNFNKVARTRRANYSQDAMLNLAKKLASRIVQPTVITGQAVAEINLEDDEILKPTVYLFL